MVATTNLEKKNLIDLTVLILNLSNSILLINSVNTRKRNDDPEAHVVQYSVATDTLQKLSPGKFSHRDYW